VRGCLQVLSLWRRFSDYMFQRLEDRIKTLCVKAAATPDSPELTDILKHLKAALANKKKSVPPQNALPEQSSPENCSTTP